MTSFPIFLSLVLVVKDQAAELEMALKKVTDSLSPLVRDYEIIVVDNASSDRSIEILKNISNENGLPNLQIYTLTKEVDIYTASWVGLENALGDYVTVIDIWSDEIGFLPTMLERVVDGTDVVFANNLIKYPQSFLYQLASWVFDNLYMLLNGIQLSRAAPHYRVISKRVINFILQHSQPAIAYRHLPATGGFSRVNLTYSSQPKLGRPKRIGQSIDRGMRLLVSTTRAPMRIVTGLSMFGALANILYSFYVLAVYWLSSHVSPGWTSLSLQQSGMFFLISLVLLVLGEYILHVASLSNEGPLYHVGREFTSAQMTRHEKLNIEEAAPDARRP